MSKDYSEEEEPTQQELITELQKLFERKVNLRECDGYGVSAKSGSATLSITKDAPATAIYFVLSNEACLQVTKICYEDGMPVKCPRGGEK